MRLLSKCGWRLGGMSRLLILLGANRRSLGWGSLNTRHELVGDKLPEAT